MHFVYASNLLPHIIIYIWLFRYKTVLSIFITVICVCITSVAVTDQGQIYSSLPFPLLMVEHSS